MRTANLFPRRLHILSGKNQSRIGTSWSLKIGLCFTNVTTDKNGSFSLADTWGIALNISVGKAGYYSSCTNIDGKVNILDIRNQTLILMAEAISSNRIQISPPFITFGSEALVQMPLVTSQYGMRDDFWVTVPKDGTPVNVDLVQRKTGNGPLEIIQNKPEFPAHGGTIESLSPSDRSKPMSATNWSITMRISDGGFIEEDQRISV